MLCAASMSPFSAMPLSGDASPTQPSAGPLQPTASLQPAIDPELFIDVFMDLVSTDYADFAPDIIHCLNVETAHCVVGIFRTYPFKILFQR